MAIEDRELVLANRSFLWNLLARGFAEEPDGAFMAIVCDPHTAQEVSLVVDGRSQAVADRWTQAVDALVQAGEPSLRESYGRIFVGPATLHSSPWETMHVTGKRILFQPGVLDVRQAYRDAGYLPERYPAVADDFIGLECDFMAKLAHEALERWRAGDGEGADKRLLQSRQFLEGHLLQWVDSLAEAIGAHYGPDFYGFFAQVAALVAWRDGAVLAALLDEKEG